MKSLSEVEIQQHVAQFRKLSNAAKIEQVYLRARELAKKHPDVFEFAYYEAVYYAEDDVAYPPAEVVRRYRVAAKKLRHLLRRMNGVDAQMRIRTRNEYYWFSKQPAKQYRLGLDAVARGDKKSYYTIGVGAAEMARQMALKGRRATSLRWAKRSEKAWLAYFKIIPDWFNSYFFYATALGLQGRETEMNLALDRARKIAGKPANWKALTKVRNEVAEALSRFS